MLLGVTVITFIIMNLAPGDPVMMFVNVERGVPTPEELGRLRAVLGLDKPAVIRYFIWLKNLVTGDFGYSYFSRQPVMNEIKTRIGTTVLLAVLSMGVSFLFGMTVGVVCALKQYKVADYILSVLAFIGLSMPGFWVAIMLIFFFTSRLGWFPSVGLSDVSLVNPGLLARIADRASHLVMPVMAMSLTSIGGWARYQRSSFLEVINQDYIRTARSKGLSENAITLRHALRNSALPIITILGDSMPILIGGAFIIESIFGLPGMGRLGINAIMNKDYPVVMGVTFFSSIMVILGTFLSDILYAVIDPRIRFR
jgi:peptide/nickel transport system permease protein